MHHATPLITTIVGGLVLAFILGMIANKLRISPLVGYLLAGVLAGPFTPGFVADTKLAPELAELGVILLMFGVGLHFSLKDLMAVKSIAIPGAIAQIAVATLLGMALSAALGWSLMTGIVFGLCLSTASTVVLLRALEERQLIDSQRGQIAIGWLIVEDLVMVLTLVLLPAIAGMAEKGNVGFASLALDLGITIGKVVAFIAIMMLVGRRLVPWIMSRSAATGSRELFTLSVLALALGIAFGAVELFDVSFALGAFFAGMVLNESELSHRAAHDTLPLRDAFAVLFFVSVGMLFDPMVLVQQPLAVLATLAIIIFGKSAAAFFLVRMFGHSPRAWRRLASLPLFSPAWEWRLTCCRRPDKIWCWPGRSSQLCSTRCCLPCWKNISIKPKPSTSRRWKRSWKTRSRCRSISATTRCWSASAASAACWARS